MNANPPPWPFRRGELLPRRHVFTCPTCGTASRYLVDFDAEVRATLERLDGTEETAARVAAEIHMDHAAEATAEALEEDLERQLDGDNKPINLSRFPATPRPGAS